MDPSGDKQNTTCSKDECGDHSPYDRDVLQPAWVRCAFRPCDELDRFLLDYGSNFLLPVGIFLWSILLYAQI